jgi:hypothetical protein
MGISAILSMISNAEALVKSIWDAYNSAPMVQAKVAQMTEDEKKQHNDLLDQAMHGNADQRSAATLELQKLVSE